LRAFVNLPYHAQKHSNANLSHFVTLTIYCQQFLSFTEARRVGFLNISCHYDPTKRKGTDL